MAKIPSRTFIIPGLCALTVGQCAGHKYANSRQNNNDLVCITSIILCAGGSSPQITNVRHASTAVLAGTGTYCT